MTLSALQQVFFKIILVELVHN